MHNFVEAIDSVFLNYYVEAIESSEKDRMMLADDLGDRMKGYERKTDLRLDPLLPICARIDGRAFSKFTRGCKKPFDYAIAESMRMVTAFLVDDTHAKIGYTQSDEITLIWQANDGGSIIFDGRVQKMASVLASTAAVVFYDLHNRGKLPSFDCRVWQVPSQTEAANVIMWRALDAKKNGISSACRVHYSAKQMHGKRQDDMREMLIAAGIDYDADYDARDRFGSYFRRVQFQGKIDDETWNRIPENKRPESRVATRSRVEEIPMPFWREITNREAVIFDAADPLT